MSTPYDMALNALKLMSNEQVLLKAEIERLNYRAVRLGELLASTEELSEQRRLEIERLNVLCARLNGGES